MSLAQDLPALLEGRHPDGLDGLDAKRLDDGFHGVKDVPKSDLTPTPGRQLL
jgi:hypothetical protein